MRHYLKKNKMKTIMDSLASVGNILSKRDIILLFTSGLAQGNSSQNLESFCDNSSTKFHGDIGSRGCRSSNKPQCQLCGKMSLTALKCYHHFDPFFTGFVFCFLFLLPFKLKYCYYYLRILYPLFTHFFLLSFKLIYQYYYLRILQ